MNLRSLGKDIIEIVLLIVLVVIPFRLFVAEPYLVKGVSMSPTYETGHYLIINKFWHKVAGFERGDVAVFKSPVDESKFYIKRIIGLPGERVRIEDQVTIIKTVDGTDITLDEPYLKNTTLGNSDVLLKNDEYFVMGDNRANSYDSRAWGALPSELIKGEPVARLFPLSQLSLMPGTFEFKE